MCVTLNPAEIASTNAYAYAGPENESGQARHFVGYQNTARNLSTMPNCMFLNYPGTDLQLVQPAVHTRSLMDDMTASLREIVPSRKLRSSGMYGSRSAVIEEFGDYTIVRAQSPHDILAILNEVREDRRPLIDGQLEAMADLFAQAKPYDSILMGCFDGQVKPKHPIVTSYIPHDPTVLAVPGLDGHDGFAPIIGAPVYRGFKLAFGVYGMPFGHQVHYRDGNINSSWAPERVVGFVDNRPNGRNGDYALPIEAITTEMDWDDEAQVLASQLLVDHL